jgi:amino-acid N-acetyltransferase
MELPRIPLFLLSMVTFSHAFLTSDTTKTYPKTFLPRRISHLSEQQGRSEHATPLSFDEYFGTANGSSHSGRNILDRIKVTETATEKTPLIDPAMLEFVQTCDIFNQDECSPEDLTCEVEEHLLENDAAYPYVDMIRGSAPYISNHRGELAVIHIPGDLLAWDELPGFMNDIALCWLLGMKIVIVVGCRRQVEDRLTSLGIRSELSGHTRITSGEQMRIVEEEAGFARFEVERILHRSLRCSQLSASPDGNVVSGNFFSASRLGIVDGVDFQRTGRPKKLNVRRVLDYLRDGEIVLMTSVGIGASGECLNVNSECLAAFAAASLGASKVVFCSNNGVVLRDKESKTTVQNFRAKDARRILDHFNVDVRNDYSLAYEEKEDLPEGAPEMLVKIGWAYKAIMDGVERAHIIAPSNGALIEELFTAKQGTGTCISEDSFESVHPDDDSGDFELANEFMDAELRQ